MSTSSGKDWSYAACDGNMHVWDRDNVSPGAPCHCGACRWVNGAPCRFAFFGAGAQVFDPVVILKPEVVRLGDGARVDSFVKIEGGQGVSIGKCTHVSSFCHINIGGGTVEIGDYVGIGSGAKILGGSNTPDGASMSAAAPADLQVVERSKTVIGNFAFVGANAVIMFGVHVDTGAAIGAGAVVTKSVPSWEIWAGVPAKKIGERSEAMERRYEMLLRPEHRE